MLRQEKVDFARRAAADGMVLLKNENATLPISKDKKIALFGVASYQCFKLGWGSGDMLAQRIIQTNEALVDAGYTIEEQSDAINKAWIEEHATEYQRVNRNWAEWTFRFNEIEMPTNIIESSAKEADVAIVSVGRCSGEADDLKNEEGFYKLHADETSLIKRVSACFEHVVLVLNTCGPLDLRSVENCKIDSILYASMGGEQFGNAVADIVSGKVSPSGKLTTTWAKKYEDYPTCEGIDTIVVPYNEGIYVGYRYFDTFNVEPMYPFGYGLSYTTFEIEPYDFILDGPLVNFVTKVTNTGKMPGKEVVECYLSSPDGKMEKAYQDLCAYSKTDIINPGESEEVVISFDLTDMASYDEEAAAYVLEKGDYIVRCGNSSRNTKVAFVIRVSKDVLCTQVSNRFKQDDVELKLISKKGIASISYPNEKAEIENAKILDLDITSIEPTVCDKYEDTPDELIEATSNDKLYTLEDVWNGKASVEDVVAQFSNEELAMILNGVIYDSADANANVGSMAIKVRGAAGELWTSDKYKIPTNACADGPGGIRLSIFGTPEESDTDVCHEMVAYPSGTCFANTWDCSIAYKFGACICDDLEVSNIEGWLAPGINIHRNPLNGRNFEYMSEDPLIAGNTGAYITFGVQYDEDTRPTGRYVAIKHFACNNIEYERGITNSVVSERALREIYLKAFKIAVTTSGALTVMTAYNKINGQFASTSFDLLNGVLRGEWGFDGVVMTDWNPCSNSKEHSYAGNDLIMPGCHKKDILEGLEDGSVSKASVQKCAARILTLILRSNYVINDR
ncbi:MAG: glycoside hydrolase family 3 protein [Clostridia bacterium]|nr:glycoside hydrolase family 3 protein [Clostridia bacterium]